MCASAALSFMLTSILCASFSQLLEAFPRHVGDKLNETLAVTSTARKIKTLFGAINGVCRETDLVFYQTLFLGAREYNCQSHSRHISNESDSDLENISLARIRPKYSSVLVTFAFITFRYTSIV